MQKIITRYKSLKVFSSLIYKKSKEMKPQINVFLIGAQKAGTTSVYDWLAQHPDIDAPSEIKDHHYFSIDSLYAKGVDYIDGFYQNNNKIKIHAAVNYMYFADKVSERIYKYNDQSKLVVCLREPKARAISAYKYFVRTSRESRLFEQALADELSGEPKTYEQLANHTYMGHGRYAVQIKKYLRHFDRSNLHIIYFEDLIRPDVQVEVMTSLCQFLGVNPNIKFRFTHQNASVTPKIQWLATWLRSSSNARILKSLIPLKYRRRYAKKIEQLNLSERPLNIHISDEAIRILNENLVDESRLIDEIIGINNLKKWHC